jgi:hypothetical protein
MCTAQPPLRVQLFQIAPDGGLTHPEPGAERWDLHPPAFLDHLVDQRLALFL